MVAAADAYHVLVGAGVKLRHHLGIVQRFLQRRGRGFGGLQGIEIQLQPASHGA